MTPLSLCSALILAGGAGSRMGLDKARLPWRRGTLLGHVARCAADAVDEVLVIGGDDPLPDDLPAGIRHLPDPDRIGPLGALRLGLEAATHPHAVLLACDMPFLEPEAIRRLRQAALDSGSDAVVPSAPDGWHPLLALYARTCLPHATAALAAGHRRPVALFDRVRVHLLDTAADAPFWARVLTNLNTPAEYEAARRIDSDPSPSDS